MCGKEEDDVDDNETGCTCRAKQGTADAGVSCQARVSSLCVNRSSEAAVSSVHRGNTVTEASLTVCLGPALDNTYRQDRARSPTSRLLDACDMKTFWYMVAGASGKRGWSLLFLNFLLVVKPREAR